MNYYLSIDIGASSGRHIITYIKNEKLYQEEIYRFKNEIIFDNGSYYWDIDRLFEHIINGLKSCKEVEMIPYSLAIDTWAVDYVLLNKDKEVIQNPYSYRDSRTIKHIDEVLTNFKDGELFYKSGIQHQSFNTIFQLYSEKSEVKDEAYHFLMIPDYFNFKLTNKLFNEYTNLSTTQLLNYKTLGIDKALYKLLGFKNYIFEDIVSPGKYLGNFSREIIDKVGFNCKVIATTSHDTASAFLASKKSDSIIISSGTWSLIGVVVDDAIVSSDAYKYNFTNEGGYDNTYRFLKNIMGLWIIQEVARNIDYKYSYRELSDLAYKSNYNEIFDVNDKRFLNPDNMIEEIKLYFKERKLLVPENINDISRTVFRSLAHSYQEAVNHIEKTLNKEFDYINIIGGGSQNKFLNKEIERITNKKLILGPIEATSLGNAAVQMIAAKELDNIGVFRKYLKEVD